MFPRRKWIQHTYTGQCIHPPNRSPKAAISSSEDTKGHFNEVLDLKWLHSKAQTLLHVPSIAKKGRGDTGVPSHLISLTIKIRVLYMKIACPMIACDVWHRNVFKYTITWRNDRNELAMRHSCNIALISRPQEFNLIGLAHRFWQPQYIETIDLQVVLNKTNVPWEACSQAIRSKEQCERTRESDMAIPTGSDESNSRATLDTLQRSYANVSHVQIHLEEWSFFVIMLTALLHFM